MRSILIFFLTLTTCSVFAQQKKELLLPDSFVVQVKRFHPLVQKANLLSSQATFELNRTRGYFDPMANAIYDEKDYKGKNYFEKLDAGLSVQTAFAGLKIKSGFSSNTGEFLNPENNVPTNGLFSAGAELPILQGLITDKYRTELRQAKINVNSLEFERQLQLNKVVLDALDNYWTWSLANWRLALLNASVNNINTRFEGVKSSFEAGDSPEIDTVETFTQMLNLKQQAVDAAADVVTANNNLQTYFWNGDKVVNLQPPDWELIEKTVLPDTANWRNQNQELNIYNLKNESLLLERRLKREYLKPELNLSYQFLTENTRNFQSTFNGLNPNDYKLGISFSFPVFMRKSVNDLRLTKLKITDNQLLIDYKEQYIEQQLNSLSNELLQLQTQIDQYLTIRKNYQRLLEAERIKNDLGDSSIFLINSRELQLINAELKLLDLIAKQKMVNAKINYTRGVL